MNAEQDITAIIDPNVKCPWCGAEPGKRCTEAAPDRPEGWKYLPHGRAHLARVSGSSKEVPDVDHHHPG